MSKIVRSVGRGGVNLYNDVIIIQKLLNKQRLPGVTGQLKYDGDAGKETITRIEIFQKHIVKMAKPDGRIDPGGKTMARLAGTTEIGKISSPSGLKTKYFVIHSTGGEMSQKTIEGFKGYEGKAHAYILRDGQLINIVPFDQKAWATKREKQDKSLIGSMYHIELNYAAGGSPNEAQYNKLAEIFKQLNAEMVKKGHELVIVPHKEVDRGLKSGHSDPENFDFGHFYDVLKNQGVDIDKIRKITPERYSAPSQADQKSNWPPILTGPVERRKADK